ncbi:hypothetical protein D3C72_626880 [compost metagenome]
MDQDRIQPVMAEYMVIMEEVKSRLHAINTILRDRNLFEPRIARESCYLQLRMIAELVALSCVVAHDKLTLGEMKNLRREYSADVILKRMERRHENFFPRAVFLRKTEDGRGHIDRTEKLGFTAAEMGKLWVRTGEVLHVGAQKKLRSRKAIDPELADVRSYVERIIDLLSFHAVITVDETHAMICEMNSADTGRVTMAIAAAEPNDEQ